MRLTDEQILLRDTARDFARNELAPHSAEWDREARFPREALAELGKLGFMGVLVPPEYGGAGADHVGYALALEEIASGDGAVSTILSVHNSVGVMPVLRYGSEEQKRRFLVPMAEGKMLACFCLTEPEAGSDAAAIRTRAVRHGNRWVVNGTKQFITSGSTADVAIVFAVTDPDAGRKGISAFIVPTGTPGYRVARLEHKLGPRASDTAQLVFEDMELTPDLMLGGEGGGVSHRPVEPRRRAYRHRGTIARYPAGASSWRSLTRKSARSSAPRSASTRRSSSGSPTWRPGSPPPGG